MNIYQRANESEFQQELIDVQEKLSRGAMFKVVAKEGKESLEEIKPNFFWRLLYMIYKPSDRRFETIQTYFENFLEANLKNYNPPKDLSLKKFGKFKPVFFEQVVSSIRSVPEEVVKVAVKTLALPGREKEAAPAPIKGVKLDAAIKSLEPDELPTKIAIKFGVEEFEIDPSRLRGNFFQIALQEKGCKTIDLSSSGLESFIREDEFSEILLFNPKSLQSKDTKALVNLWQAANFLGDKELLDEVEKALKQTFVNIVKSGDLDKMGDEVIKIYHLQKQNVPSALIDFFHEQMITDFPLNVHVSEKFDLDANSHPGFAALCYERGMGVPMDTNESFELYMKAYLKSNKADLQNRSYIYMLGRGFIQGDAVPKNRELALHCTQQAAGKGLGIAAYDMGLFHKKRRELTQAQEYFKKAAEDDYAPAYIRMAKYQDLSLSPEKQAAETLKWLQKAADAGNEEAYYQLGKQNLDAIDEKERNLALHHLKKAADLGHQKALDVLFHLQMDSPNRLVVDGKILTFDSSKIILFRNWENWFGTKGK